MNMKNLTQEKQTIDFERKMFFKNLEHETYPKKAINQKRSEQFGHVKSKIKKYGLKQCLERYDCYDILS